MRRVASQQARFVCSCPPSTDPRRCGFPRMGGLPLLIHGRDPLVRQLAEDIIAGQTTEVMAMRARLSRLRQGPDAAPDGFPAIGSTRGVMR